MNLEDVSKRTIKRVSDRLKKTNSKEHPALKRLEDAFKKIK